MREQIYRNTGDFERALPVYEKALLIHQTVLGYESLTVATSYFYLGYFFFALFLFSFFFFSSSFLLLFFLLPSFIPLSWVYLLDSTRGTLASKGDLQKALDCSSKV